MIKSFTLNQMPGLVEEMFVPVLSSNKEYDEYEESPNNIKQWKKTNYIKIVVEFDKFKNLYINSVYPISKNRSERGYVTQKFNLDQIETLYDRSQANKVRNAELAHCYVEYIKRLSNEEKKKYENITTGLEEFLNAKYCQVTNFNKRNVFSSEQQVTIFNSLLYVFPMKTIQAILKIDNLEVGNRLSKIELHDMMGAIYEFNL